MKESPHFQTTLSGIPCGVVVDDFVHVPQSHNSPHLCASDADYYGYTQIDFHLLDRKGYPAPWLASKLTPQTITTLEEEITIYQKGLEEYFLDD